jgi:hypothetical protein
MVRAWWVLGVIMVIAGAALGFLFPNPWGWDGHDLLTCGSAFLGDGYQPSDPDCPTRRLLSGSLATFLVIAGALLAWRNVRARRRAVRSGL